MQRSWRTDCDKLTFIACYAPEEGGKGEGRIVGEKDDAAERMVGDVNLFLSEEDEEDDDEMNEQHTAGPNEKRKSIIGELEIMLAHKTARGQGLAQEVLRAFMWYIITSLTSILEEYRAGSDAGKCDLKYLRVKIDQHNVRSLALFQRLGFEKMGEEPNYFGEVELRMQMENVDDKFGEGADVKKLAYGK